jgi:membrane protein insertase Oxa1/YidC/SpoIIIJ
MFLQDLSAPDTLVHWQTPFYLPGRDIPLLGWLVGSVQGMLAGGPGGITSLNLLPILMGVGMHLQQKLTPQPAAAQGSQAGQQKQMMAFMSIFLTVMLYSAPAGLCLYIFTSTFLGYFEQKYLKQKMAEVAATAATSEAGGKAAEAAPAGPAGRKSLVAGREKSPAERIQAWLQRLLTPPQQDDEAPKGKPRRK